MIKYLLLNCLEALQRGRDNYIKFSKSFLHIVSGKPRSTRITIVQARVCPYLNFLFYAKILVLKGIH